MRLIRVTEIEVEGLGDRIRKARKDDGRNLTDIASAAGMSAQNWHRIESEKQVVTEEVLRKIESVLGVDFGVSFEESGNES